jgi:hypothetical protein
MGIAIIPMDTAITLTAITDLIDTTVITQDLHTIGPTGTEFTAITVTIITTNLK